MGGIDAFMRAWIEEMEVAKLEKDRVVLPEQEQESALLRGWMIKRKLETEEEDNTSRQTRRRLEA